MDFLSVVNLNKYQHYSKRNPPWVKLHRDAMTDYTMRTFTPATRFLFSMFWLIASECDNQFPYDLRWLSERIGMKVTDDMVQPLIAASKVTLTCVSASVSASVSPLSDASDVLAGCKQDASKMLAVSEAADFERFWEIYPRKIGKKAAYKAWLTAKDKPTIDRILAAVRSAMRSPDWIKDNGKYIPHPATWLNQGRWADEYTVPAPRKERLPL